MDATFKCGIYRTRITVLKLTGLAWLVYGITSSCKN
jgi:hypothetical protein